MAEPNDSGLASQQSPSTPSRTSSGKALSAELQQITGRPSVIASSGKSPNPSLDDGCTAIRAAPIDEIACKVRERIEPLLEGR